MMRQIFRLGVPMRYEVVICPHCGNHALIKMIQGKGLPVLSPEFMTAPTGHLMVAGMVAAFDLSTVDEQVLHRAVAALGLPSRRRSREGHELGLCISALSARHVLEHGNLDMAVSYLHAQLGLVMDLIMTIVHAGQESLQTGQLRNCQIVARAPMGEDLEDMLPIMQTWVDALYEADLDPRLVKHLCPLAVLIVDVAAEPTHGSDETELTESDRFPLTMPMPVDDIPDTTAGVVDWTAMAAQYCPGKTPP